MPFSGWQAQPKIKVDTVQEALEKGLGSVAGIPIRTYCAARTDAGVHGFAQIVHFVDSVGRSPKAWVLGTNRSLPNTIRVHWVTAVPSDFHARFSALCRRYCYIICNTPTRSALMEGLVTWYRYPLDVILMNETAQCLIGEHDFSAFRAASCQSRTPFREVFDVDVYRKEDLVIVDITANAFLHHMVRNVVGSLLAVGSGHKARDWFSGVFKAGDRTQASETAAPEGLYLTDVRYSEALGLPKIPDGPPILHSAV